MPLDGTIRLGVSLSPKDVKQSAKELQEAVEEVFNDSAGKNLTSTLKGIQTQMAKATEKANDLVEKIEELDSKKAASDRITNMAEEIKTLTNQYEELAVSAGDNATTAQEEQLNGLAEQIITLTNEYERLKDTQPFTAEDEEQLNRYKKELNNVNNTLSVLLARYHEKQNIEKQAPSVTGPAFTSITKGAKNSLKQIRSLALGILGVRGAFSIVRKATSAYLSTNEKLSKRMNAIWASLGELLGPVIEYLINLISRLFGYFNSFIKALTGIDLAAKANAKSLKKQSDAMKGLNRQQAKFDEMNTLSDSSGKGNSADFNFPDVAVQIDSVGGDIANKLNELITNFDWAGLAQKISDGINFALETAIDFVMNFNLLNLINGIFEFLMAIDWGRMIANVFKLLGEVIGSLTGTLTGFLAELLQSAWTAIKDYFGGYIEQAKEEFPDNMFGLAGNIIDGLLMGIWDAIKNIGVWIYDHIFKPFIDGFKEAFKISSPSKVMEDMGQFIIDGLVNGVSGVWEAIKKFFVNLPTYIKNIFTSLPTWFKSLWDKLKVGASNAWEGIKSVFSRVGTFFKDTFTKAWTAVKNVFSTGGKIFDGIKEGIANAFKTIVNGLITGINKVVAVPFKAINTALQKIKDISIFGAKPFNFISTISVPQIPKLAQGAVIPPNKEFMAILGDQKQGTNIEAPLDTIVDAFRKVQGEYSQPITIELKVDGKTLAKTMVDAQKKLGFSFNG